ncbi:hypothetical protein I7V28_19300 [Lelliottia amnigena]|jgi:hypothetical protein|uniref:hypothetical protein n=1 Tax=Lelliottia TaxID=1330545 RepID=UPI00192B25EF|nr:MULTISPECIES: hypothetical protein [Lelliottia]MBL5885651.1 hypothetical protein [Lelliottia aquatilis]MBL5923229.1 hypothetical protein [Lelliottia amnigena]MBL5932139.1 hypothetical protein [Lelliottia amnigena]
MTQQDKSSRHELEQCDLDEDIPFTMDAFERNRPTRHKVQHVQLRGESAQCHDPDSNHQLDDL